MVLDHVVGVGRRSDYRLDLRHYYKGAADYRAWKAGACRSGWKALIEASMRRVLLPLPLTGPQTRVETREREQEIVRDLHAQQLPVEILATRWKEQTGKSLDTYYRHRRAMRLS